MDETKKGVTSDTIITQHPASETPPLTEEQSQKIEAAVIAINELIGSGKIPDSDFAYTNSKDTSVQAELDRIQADLGWDIDIFRIVADRVEALQEGRKLERELESLKKSLASLTETIAVRYINGAGKDRNLTNPRFSLREGVDKRNLDYILNALEKMSILTPDQSKELIAFFASNKDELEQFFSLIDTAVEKRENRDMGLDE